MSELSKGGMPIGTVKTWGQGKQWIKTAEGWVPYEGENKEIKEKTEIENVSKKYQFLTKTIGNVADKFINGKIHLEQFKKLNIKSLNTFKESLSKDNPKHEVNKKELKTLLDFIDKKIAELEAVETKPATFYFQDIWDKKKERALKATQQYQKENPAIQNYLNVKENIHKSFK